MTAIPHWHLSGDWFDVCSCDIPCPCEFAQAPTNNRCLGVLAYSIRKGQYGDIQLDGLNVLAIGTFEGNLWAGDTKASMGIYFDERADERQLEALKTIFGGHAGGWPAGFASLIGDMRGIASAPIAIDIAPDLAYWRAEVPGKVRVGAEALSGPTTPPGQRVQLVNPPGSEVGPGQIATWGSATPDQHLDAFGFGPHLGGKSSKHIPFEWSGPS
jgi:hypothetical protein